MKTHVTTHVPIHGNVAPGFETVQTEFARNFTERGELGSACTIYYRGDKVVDLWGGYRDPHKQLPWQEDTMVLVFSSTKGLAGLTMALAHSRGLFGVPTFLPPKIPAKDLRGCCYSRSSPLSVDHVFIEGISASETGHLHDFGNRVVLGRIEFFGACQISWFYFLNRFWSAAASAACACCI